MKPNVAAECSIHNILFGELLVCGVRRHHKGFHKWGHGGTYGVVPQVCSATPCPAVAYSHLCSPPPIAPSSTLSHIFLHIVYVQFRPPPPRQTRRTVAHFPHDWTRNSCFPLSVAVVECADARLGPRLRPSSLCRFALFSRSSRFPCFPAGYTLNFNYQSQQRPFRLYP